MAIAGLATYQSFSMNYSVRRDSKDSDSGDGGNFMNQMLTFHKKDTATVQDKDGKDVSADKEAASELRFGGIQGMSPVGKYGELKPYTRCITANIKTKEMIAHENNGQMVYSYQEEEKSFSIFINSDGKDKTYTIKGVDENGQEIEEEFNPYDLDPEMMDFPEFSALCMYIRQTDETADLMTKMAFTDTSYFDGIFEKGDRVPMLKDYAEEYREVTPSLADLASKLFDAINEFFEKTAWNNSLSDDKLSMLLEDKDTVEQKETVTPLNGMGTLSVGNMRYVMPASEVFKPGSSDAIVRVHVGDQDIDGNIKQYTVIGGGGRISGPSKEELREIEAEKKSKMEKEAAQKRIASERSKKAADEQRRIEAEIYHRQLLASAYENQALCLDAGGFYAYWNM